MDMEVAAMVVPAPGSTVGITGGKLFAGGRSSVLGPSKGAL